MSLVSVALLRVPVVSALPYTSPEHVLGVELPILKAGVEAKEILRCGGTLEGVTQLMPLQGFEKTVDVAARCATTSHCMC